MRGADWRVAGRFAIEHTSVRAVYAFVGLAVTVIALFFSQSPVGKASAYLTPPSPSAAAE